jgi:serine protease Do
MPSVVYIFVEIDGNGFNESNAASGSGVILRSDGYILTNKHVVEDAKRVEVTLQDRHVYESTGIWLDDILDLAVIKIDKQDLPAATFGDPDSIRVGDLVIALGHPLGLSPKEGGATVTMGIVSNLGRSFVLQGIPYYDVIQTDAAVNPGNSGGPLINSAGDVIGINSAGLSQAQNINFAINIGIARHVFEDLIQFGQSHHPYLGATLEDVTPSMEAEISTTPRVGAVITDIEPGGPAEQAGLQKEDIIIRFNGNTITSVSEFVKVLWRNDVGDLASLGIWRDKEEIEIDVTLGQRPRSDVI